MRRFLFALVRQEEDSSPLYPSDSFAWLLTSRCAPWRISGPGSSSSCFQVALGSLHVHPAHSSDSPRGSHARPRLIRSRAAAHCLGRFGKRTRDRPMSARRCVADKTVPWRAWSDGSGLVLRNPYPFRTRRRTADYFQLQRAGIHTALLYTARCRTQWPRREQRGVSRHQRGFFNALAAATLRARKCHRRRAPKPHHFGAGRGGGTTVDRDSPPGC